MEPKYQFAIRLDIHQCRGCGTCAEKCPVEAITMWRGFPHRNDDCIYCGICLVFCPNEALYLARENVADVQTMTGIHKDGMYGD